MRIVKGIQVSGFVVFRPNVKMIRLPGEKVRYRAGMRIVRRCVDSPDEYSETFHGSYTYLTWNMAAMESLRTIMDLPHRTIPPDWEKDQ